MSPSRSLVEHLPPCLLFCLLITTACGAESVSELPQGAAGSPQAGAGTGDDTRRPPPTGPDACVCYNGQSRFACVYSDTQVPDIEAWFDMPSLKMDTDARVVLRDGSIAAYGDVGARSGEGKVLWKKHLPGILLRISKSPWLGIATSVRTSYEDMIRPEGLVPSRLIRAEHYGFADHEYEATRTFFDHFGIQRPSIPLLVPEFQNPLFLKIFCQGLENN